MLSLRMSLLCALLAVLLLSGSVSAHKAKPVSSTGAPGSGVGSVSQVSKAVFSDPNDSFDCLALSINGVRTYAASGGGDIFYFTTGSPTVNLKPAYASGGDPSTANFVACQADEQGETLWLLDTRGGFLYSWDYRTPSVAPLVLAIFPDEQPGALQAMAIDTVKLVAYVGTRMSDLIYTVNLKQNGTSYSAFSAAQVGSDITAMALSVNRRDLYYASPAPSQGAPGSINFLTVADVTSGNTASPKVLVQSTSIIWPDTLLFNEPQYDNLLYFKDGGGLHGTGNPSGQLTQSISQLKLQNSKVTTLYSSTSVNMPTGLAILPSNQLLYTTTSTINSLTIASMFVTSSSSVKK